jgi:hypothetical protein
MSNVPGSNANNRPARNRGWAETKAFYKTSEFIAYVVISLAVLIAAAMVDNGEDGQGFGADKAWSYVALLTVGYMISRGLAKSGTRARDNDDA